MRGTSWFTGNGAPPAEIPGALENDLYLDLDTGDVYQLATPSGIPIGDLPALGAEFQGGYYGGLYSMNGDGTATHALIIAPRPTGQTSDIAWKDADTASAGTDSLFDGLANTLAAEALGNHPAAAWARGLAIGDYDDWYIPSRMELLSIYWLFKPEGGGDYPNTEEPGAGVNLYSVPQRGEFGYENNPTSTTVPIFGMNQAQSFSQMDTYGTSSESAAGTNHGLRFLDGIPSGTSKTTTRHWRAIRRVAVTA